MNFISGGLTKIQETLADPGSVLQDYVTILSIIAVQMKLCCDIKWIKKFQETLVDPRSVLQEYFTTINHNDSSQTL